MELCENHMTIIGFFAPWCPHCVVFKPSFEKAMLKSDIKLDSVHWEVVIEGTPEGDSIIARYNVRKFPTVLLNKNNKIIEYEGPRTTEGLGNIGSSYPIIEQPLY